MKTTELFKQTIKSYLDGRAGEDELFAQSYAKENKNIDDCVNYILGQVQKQGYAGYADDEIFGMAVHYYDEDELGNIKPVEARVVVNRVAEYKLTEEDKREARENALKAYQQQLIQEEQKKAEEAKKKAAERDKQRKAELASMTTGSLFDL